MAELCPTTEPSNLHTMKIVIPGGTGHVGAGIADYWRGAGHQVVIITRKPTGPNQVAWDGKTLGPWASEIDGAGVVLNLAGRTVNCRYNATNLAEMKNSRTDSTKVVGQAIQQAKNPPKVWLQMSTATIYAHRFDAPNDEATGIIGGQEPNAPPKWVASIDIAKAWEKAASEVHLPSTRLVLLRSAMVMSPEPGSIFETLTRLARRGLGGTSGNGKQFLSWIHQDDFNRSLDFLIERDDLSGPVNLASPHPLPNREFNQLLREVLNVKIGLPAMKWMLEIGALMMGTETELILKSRRVVPGRLLDAGFQFRFPEWKGAATNLASRLAKSS